MPAPIDAISTLTLDFVIVGGGLAGFSVAHVLAKAGHNVRVLEKLPALGAPAGGLRIPPDMSKLLEKWVGAEELRKTAVENTATPLYDLHTGEKIGVAQWGAEVLAETGGDFLLMKHEDVLKLLYNLATQSGATIDFGVIVEAVIPGNPNPTVKLSTGETLTADIVIGADGPRSMVRNVVLAQEDDAKPSGLTVFGATLPAAEMMKDPELAALLQADEWPIMMGTGRSLCGHPVHAKAKYAIQLFWPDESSGTFADSADPWYDAVPTSDVDTSGLSPLANKLLRLAPTLYRARWMKHEEGIDEWIDASGRIVLVGEAAHPWFPGGMHGPAMALEDAVVFGMLFSHMTEWTQVPASLHAYQELRQPRTARVLNVDIVNETLMRMPPGPERDTRNAELGRMQNLVVDGSHIHGFQDLADVFNYDAEDAAQEWWATWGRFYCRDSVKLTLESLSLEEATA